MLKSFNGQVAIITGAASGIGKAIARAFATEGASVMVADLDRRQSESAADQIAEDTCGNATGVAMDVTDEASVESGIETAETKYGKINILVHCAGIQFISALESLAYSDWKRVIAVHLDGAFLTTRACLRRMYAANQGGSIIYMGSVHSKTASVLKAPYVAAKHGILGLCRAVAIEGAAHGVRANVICPSFVRTPLVEKQIPEQAHLRKVSEEEIVRILLERTVDKEFTTTDEVAKAALFLASQESLVLTGQSMNVSHGWLMD